MRYALVELLSGLLFLSVFLRLGFVWHTPIYIVFTSLLLISAFTDIDHWIILDRICLGGAVAGLLLALVVPFLPPDGSAQSVGAYWLVGELGPFPGGVWWGPFLNAVVGALAASSLLWLVGFVGKLIFRREAMGFGDVKLLVMIGAFAGWQIAILSIFLASFFGSIYGIAMILASRIRRILWPAPRAGAICGYEEIQGLLDDDSEQARARNWVYSTEEKAALNRLLSAPRIGSEESRHHLPFGPHLALAAWLLVLFGPQVINAIRVWLEPLSW
jgi:leader peptidase (prepilin peptidase)/N-methyltransferase